MAKILLVEDDVNLIQALETFLVFEGHRVRRAENGTQAFTAALDDTPDIIVSDVMMPDMDGITLLRALKAAPMLAHIPVILTTAINVSHALPVQAFLPKPFSAVELVDLIDRLLSSRP